MIISFRLVVATAIVALVGACDTAVKTHGHRLVDADLSRIQTGLTTQAEVAALLGSPSVLASFDDRSWYYVERRVEEQTFYNRSLTNQDVVHVRFNDQGIVESIEHFDMSDGHQIAFNDDETPTSGNELSLVEQFIGNIGRFNPAPSDQR